MLINYDFYDFTILGLDLLFYYLNLFLMNVFPFFSMST